MVEEYVKIIVHCSHAQGSTLKFAGYIGEADLFGVKNLNFRFSENTNISLGKEILGGHVRNLTISMGFISTKIGIKLLPKTHIFLGC